MSASHRGGVAPYVGEFRYVFYAPRERYEDTLAFYRDVLGLPIVGGFSHGTYFQASMGVIHSTAAGPAARAARPKS